jgi:molybdate transport system regulatory protein
MFQMKKPGPCGGRAVTPCLKIRLSTGEHGGFGEGRWRLLLAIEREGSLRAAAAALDISYRKAWGDLKGAEKALGIRLIDKDRGGAEHGGTQLTEEGRRVVRSYGRMVGAMEKALEKEYSRHFGDFFE